MIRLGIVGSGYIAETHAASIESLANAELAGVAGGTRASKFAKKHDTRLFHSVNNLMESDTIDAVVLCSPHGAHYEQAMAAAKNNKHILVEKPIALTVKESDEISRACEESFVKLMVAHSQRYFPTNMKVKEMLDSGEFGKVLMIRSTQMGAGLDLRTLPEDHWALDSMLGGMGSTLGYGVHNVDKVLWWLNQEPDYVFGSFRQDWMNVPKDNSSFIHFKTTQNVDVSLWFQGSFGGRMFDYQRDCAEIVCEKAHIECQTYRGVRISEGDNDWHPLLTINFKSERPKIYRAVVRDFIDSIESGSDTKITGYDGLKAVKMIELGYESSKSGGIVTWTQQN